MSIQMLGLPNGEYVSDGGSRVKIFGDHGGSFEIDFDWLEEGACVESRPSVYEGRLIWSDCECCGSGGSTELVAVRVRHDRSTQKV